MHLIQCIPGEYQGNTKNAEYWTGCDISISGRVARAHDDIILFQGNNNEVISCHGVMVISFASVEASASQQFRIRIFRRLVHNSGEEDNDNSEENEDWEL